MATSQTGLTSNNAGKALNITQQNTGAGATALGLTVAAGKTPFTVNSGTKVANLNADKVDGLDSTAFLRTTGKAADSNLLDGIDSSGFYAAGSKVADSDLLDGMDSSALMTGPGKVRGAAIALSPFNGVNFTVMEEAGFFRIGYLCPDPPSGNGVFRLNNRTGETINVFMDNGGTNPEYVQLAAGAVADRAANAAGEWSQFQIHSPSQGIADISMFSVHRASDCHIQAQATIAK
jgi:hypothetical protein